MSAFVLGEAKTIALRFVFEISTNFEWGRSCTMSTKFPLLQQHLTSLHRYMLKESLHQFHQFKICPHCFYQYCCILYTFYACEISSSMRDFLVVKKE